MINGYVDSGTMYFAMDGLNIVAAAALTMSQGEDYHPIKWGLDLEDDEVAVVHILCADPARKRSGLAKHVMVELENIARENGKKAVRFDALSCNIPAHNLYESLGYQKRGVQNWYAENTGWIDFFLFEKKL